MARTVAGFPAGERVTDHVSLGVIAQRIPQEPVFPLLIIGPTVEHPPGCETASRNV